MKIDDDVEVIDFSITHFPTREDVKNSIKPKVRKQVLEFDLDGNLLNIYNTLENAARLLDIPIETIGGCCRGDTLCCRKASRIFLYSGDDIAERLKKLAKKGGNREKGYPKEVSEYTLKGKFVAVYPNIKTAGEVNSISTVKITNCCNGKTLYVGNKIFLYSKDSIEERMPLVRRKLFIESKKRKKCTQVYEYTLDGQFTASYISASEAARSIEAHASQILDCCRGRFHHNKNKKLLFIKDRIFLFPGDSISKRLELINSNKNSDYANE